MDFKKIIKFYITEHFNRYSYIETLPIEIKEVIFDNEFTNNLEKVSDYLLEQIIQKDILEWIYWYCYEWDENNNNMININNISYSIQNVDDLLNMLENEYSL